MSRVATLIALALTVSCSSKPKPSTMDERGLAWLMANQRPDGTWTSKTYTVMDAGVSTAFALFVVSLAPDEVIALHRAAINRALALPDDTGSGYPTYARALRILALSKLKPDAWRERVRKLARQLSETQFKHGGWDRGASAPQEPPIERLDISVTAFAAEALRAAGGHEEALVRAKAFAIACTNADGGGFFTPTAPWSEHLNKAGDKRSYGTTTSDVARVLRASSSDDAAAVAWLDAHFKADAVPGFSGEGERLDEAMSFYWLLVAARLDRPAWKPPIRARLASLQKADGSWSNANGLMKEDDPLIATGLALGAWWHSR